MAFIAPLQSNAVPAQEKISYDAPCFNTAKLFDSLKQDHNETPIIYGTTSDKAKSMMSLWIHPGTNTWTLVATKGSTSCVLGVGTEFKVVPDTTKKIL